MAQLVERKTPFGLLFLDIDRFKSINDQLGHEVGDIVLARIAKYIQNGIRSNDFCGRYGGEEFIIVVHGADELLTSKVAERHRRAISKLTFEPKGPKHPVTVSVGVAAYDPEQNDDVNVVVRRADRALYRAKNTGRNRVVVASELPVTHSLLPPSPSKDASIRLQPPASEDYAQVEAALLHALDTGRAALPVLPEIATRALRLASDPNTDLRAFSALVDRDPHIAARFLSIANSVIYSRGIKTTTTNAAVVRVGLLGARDIIFQVVYSTSTLGLPRYQEAVGASFHRSVRAAVAARQAARLLGERFPYAYLAGLLHDIGEARIYRTLAEMPKLPSDAIAAELVERHHCRAGADLADVWNLPEEIVHACGHHHEIDDQSVAVRLVRLADAVVQHLETPEDERPEDWFVPFGLEEEKARKLVEAVERADVVSAAAQEEPEPHATPRP